MRKMNSSRRAMIISLVMHSIAFVIISVTGIKFGSEFSTQGRVQVSFVEVKNERVLKRSIPVRDLVFDNPLEQKPDYEPISTNANNQSGGLNISVNNSSHKTTELRSITPISVDGISTRKLLTEFGVRPKSIAVRDTQVRTAQPNAQMSDGFKLIDNKPAELVKPKIKVSTTDQRNVLQDFLNGIKIKINSKKKYPPAARNAGIEGSSGIHMTILKDGQLEDLRIYESSGNEILDNAALESVRYALPFPPIPEEAGREKIEIKFYLVFKII